MKRGTRWLLWLLLMLSPVLAGAQDQAQEKEALTYAALEQSAQAILDALPGYALVNEPMDTYDPSGDGAYLYDYGALRLVMTGTQATLENVRQIELVSDGIAAPGGVRVGDSLDSVLEAFACHNQSLAGDESFATLYAQELYGQGRPEYDWAWILRAEETAYGVQYACSAPLADGTYADAGILFILTQDVVSGIRLYGFSERVSAQEAAMNFDTARDIQGRDTFTPTAPLAQKNALPVLVQEELLVNGVKVLGIDEAALTAVLGKPEAEWETADEQGGVQRTLSFPGVDATLGADGTVWQAVLTGAQAMGPRGLTIGMRAEDALALLRVDGQVREGTDATLYMEGEAADDPPYAYMDFFAGGHSAIRVGVRLEGETDRAAMLYVDIAGGVVEEIRLYRYML